MTNGEIIGIDRRAFLLRAGIAAAISSVPFAAAMAEAERAGASVALPALPYAKNSLAPAISERTISFHYDRHHQGYVNNTLKLVAGTDLEKASLEDIIKRVVGKAEQSALFNNAAQVYNHSFYWTSMKPDGGGPPKGGIADRIGSSFGSYQKFVDAFTSAATTQFGSGWAWLVQDGAKLQVIKTPNAETALTMSVKPLVTIDVWEHAYYLDYQNNRAAYIKAFIDTLLNWDFAEKNLA